MIARRRFVDTQIFHSDRGSQFRSRDFVAVLKAAGLSGSMGYVAAAGDNAAMESFNSLLQKNVLDRHRWSTRDDLRYAIILWVEHTYIWHGRQRRLGRLTSGEFEARLYPRGSIISYTATVNRSRGRPQRLWCNGPTLWTFRPVPTTMAPYERQQPRRSSHGSANGEVAE